MPLGRIWNFLKRHKRKFLFTGAFVGGTYLAFQYFKKKIQEIQEKEATDCINHARRQHHFDSNQRTCNMTVLTMLPNLREAMRSAMDCESIKARLDGKPENKVELWEELKVLSFTRAILAAYSSCILVVLLRVQLNVIGGYMYLDNVLQRNGTNDVIQVAPPDVQERYLSLVQYFVTQGIRELGQAIQGAVTDVLQSKSLKQKFELGDVQTMIEAVRLNMECGIVQASSTIATMPLCHFMLPPEQVQDFESDISAEDLLYDELLNETRDMVESEDFHSVLQVCLNRAFARLMDFVAEGYKGSQNNGIMGELTCKSMHERSVPLAKLIPVASVVMHRMCGDAPNSFIQEMLMLEPLRDLAANVYEAFSQHEDSPDGRKLLH